MTQSLTRQKKALQILNSSSDASCQLIIDCEQRIANLTTQCDRLGRYSAELSNEQSYLDKQKLTDNALYEID